MKSVDMDSGTHCSLDKSNIPYPRAIFTRYHSNATRIILFEWYLVKMIQLIASGKAEQTWPRGTAWTFLERKKWLNNAGNISAQSEQP